MQSVTSNAVARAIQKIKSYFNTEQLTGGKWVNGKPIYRIAFENVASDIGAGSDTVLTSVLTDKNVETLVTLRGCLIFNNFGAVVPMPNAYIFLRYDKNDKMVYIRNIYSGSGQNVTVSFIAEYTKTTD